MDKEIKVVELFAGVGGFRVGLERASKLFNTIWANQWEPSTKVQHAFEVYEKHFGGKSINVNEDISKVWEDIPEHDLLVGGFPCQDYSVAQGNRAKGINGKKGVLWWEIHKIIKKNKPSMILLENVDRLLTSPSDNKGRDFAIMLKSMNDLGYVVEWKMIKASDYGFVQKRKRVFIYAYKTKDKYYPNIEYIKNNSLLEKTFISKNYDKEIKIDLTIYKDLVNLTKKYNQGRFNYSGIAIGGQVYTVMYKTDFDTPPPSFKTILDKNKKNYVYLTEEQSSKAAYTKEHKKIERISKTGFKYNYTEGKMSYPDNLDAPGRTMLTSEGTINRSTHFIKHGNKIRFMTPLEAERLNGFSDNWTDFKPNRQRFFFMGNALVIGMVEKIGKEIIKKW